MVSTSFSKYTKYVKSVPCSSVKNWKIPTNTSTMKSWPKSVRSPDIPCGLLQFRMCTDWIVWLLVRLGLLPHWICTFLPPIHFSGDSIQSIGNFILQLFWLIHVFSWLSMQVYEQVCWYEIYTRNLCICIITPRPGVPPEGRHTRPGGISITYDIQLGRSTRVLGNITVPPPLNFTFNWEDQQGY